MSANESRGLSGVYGARFNSFVRTADYELSKINRETLPGNETAVGTLSGGQVTDLSCAPPHCISHKRGLAETWDPVWGTGNNAFPVPIYRPTRTLLCILAILLNLIIGQK